MEVKPSKPRRRWFQFSLRTILIPTTIIAVLLGWWSHKARQQREAVAILKGTDGQVRYDCRLPWTGKMCNPPEWPKWLLDNVGVDYFTSAELLSCGTEVTDGSLEHLKGLTTLQTLSLGRTQVTDAGLKHLKGLTALQVLWLGGTHVTDAGVTQLKKALPNCKIER